MRSHLGPFHICLSQLVRRSRTRLQNVKILVAELPDNQHILDAELKQLGMLLHRAHDKTRQYPLPARMLKRYRETTERMLGEAGSYVLYQAAIKRQRSV